MASCSRRNLFKLAGAGSLALLLPATSRMAMAQEKLDPASPQASALGYVHDTTEVDQGKWASHSVDQKCSNCQLLQAGDGEWVGCSIFPGKLVNREGWCSAWVQAQG